MVVKISRGAFINLPWQDELDLYPFIPELRLDRFLSDHARQYMNHVNADVLECEVWFTGLTAKIGRLIATASINPSGVC